MLEGSWQISPMSYDKPKSQTTLQSITLGYLKPALELHNQMLSITRALPRQSKGMS